uniref:Uncharacterized protein n=1 Tax=Sus scrofa TaxID=9823 RepID=A0A4X1V729_PIG
MPDPSRFCDLHHSSWQRRILNPLSEARDRTHNLMVPSQICFRCTTMGTLSLIRSHLFIFIFAAITLGGGSEKMLLSFMSESVWPVFSSKSFMVSGLISRSLIHLEFIFVYGVRECSNFILFHVAIWFPQHHLLNKLSFLHCIFLPLLS